MDVRLLEAFRAVVDPFAEAGVEWSPVVEAEYFASVCGLVGPGWSVVDPLSASTFRHLGLSRARSSLPSIARSVPFARAIENRRSWRNPS